MRKVIVCNIVSLDGFYAAEDGDPLVLQMDEAFDLYNLERITHADAILLGRESYLGFGSYWPFIADAPADPNDPALDEVNRNISRSFNALPKIVASDTLTVGADHPWHDSTSVVPRAGIAQEIHRLRASGSGDIVVFGSHLLWNGLLRAKLIDEMHLMVSPHPLGVGVPIFTAPSRLALLGTRRFDGSDNVVLTYAPEVS